MSLSECFALFDKRSWDLLELYTAVFLCLYSLKKGSGL